jgi:hypothetical protein
MMTKINVKLGVWQFAYWKNIWHVRIVNKNSDKNWWLKTGRICVELSDQLEKQLRFKTIEKFGGKKGDLTRAVEEAVKTWITKG